MDYLKFYELGVEPFRNDPDVAFFFESRGQRAAPGTVPGEVRTRARR